MRTIASLVLIGTLAIPAMAQQRDGENAARLVDAVGQCREIADPAARLACFDTAAGALAEARDKKELVVVSKDDVQKTRRTLFGISLPRINLFGGDDKDEESEVKEINAKIVSAGMVAYNRWNMTLDDGSVWQAQEPLKFDPRSGDDIRIKRSAFDNYFGSVNGKLGFRIKRVR